MPVSKRRLAAPVVLAAILSLLPAPSPGQVVGEEVTIIRDRYGVPHVFARTESGAAYGAGYALAQDRLWQMHVFRHIAKGRLSELFGPSVVGTDRTVRFFTYTAAERSRRMATYPQDIRRLLDAFVLGINIWIRTVNADPSQLPLEFAEFGVGRVPEWTVDDTVALQDVLILAFGSGGGNELAHAALLNELVKRFGEEQGRRMFDDLVVTVDDDGPMTIPRGYPYTERSTFAREDDAESRRGLTGDARIGLTPAPTNPSRSALVGGAPPPMAGTLQQLSLIPDVDAALEGFREIREGVRSLRAMFRFGSNAQVVGPSLSEAGNSLQTAGPQVGYLVPQWLTDFGLHGGTFDTTGMTFAGAGPAVLIGRGPGYAWTTTTGASDLTDTYVERLNPANPREYEWNGAFERMDCRTETFTFRGVPFESREICRTRHGPVVSFDTANGVAYSVRYAWFGREGQTVEGFFRYNQVRSVEDFATFANYLSSNHNMFYVDDQGNYGYWHPGNFPVRAPGIDIRLPQDGRGGSEWQGLLPVSDTPHAVNFERGWLANWNNQPAEGWERERGYPALDNATDLEDAINPEGRALPDPDGGLVNSDGQLDFEDLSANLRYAAFKHHRHTYFGPYLPSEGELSSELPKKALAVLREWDGFLVDRDGDGRYDSAGKTVLDRWVSTMRGAAFNDDLGNLSGWAREDLLWHLLNPADRLQQGHNWLNGQDSRAFVARAFEDAVAALAAQFQNQDPATWREKAELQHYQRINADLVADLAQTSTGQDASRDSGLPGDVPDHIRMDRGTYNHVVVYQTPPTGSGVLGDAVSKAGSVIPPGQCGYVDLSGRECRHFQDQLDLYVQWRYKPMPLTASEAKALAESTEVIVYPGMP